MYLEPKEPLAQQIGQAAGYTGQKYRLRTVAPEAAQSYHAAWDSGSRTSYTFVNLETWQTVPLPAECSNPFRAEAYATFTLPFNVAVIEHSIFRGKDMGVTLVVREDNATKMLPMESEGLTAEQKTVLEYTASLKSSYGGIKNFRWTEANRRTGISQEAWERAKQALISSGHLNKAGAITVKGRNARSAA